MQGCLFSDKWIATRRYRWGDRVASRLVRSVCAVATVVALAIVGAGCGSTGVDEAAIPPGAPITIGYLASLTGYCDTYAKQYVEGAQLAVRLINEEGGVLGHPLRLEVRDDRGNAAVGVSQARSLLASGNVKFLAGTCSDAVAKSVAEEVANPDHVIYVVGAADPSIFRAGPRGYVFGTIPTTNLEGRFAASYVRTHLRWKRIAVVAEDYTYGYQVTAAFDKAMRGSGQAIVSQDFVPSGGTDDRALLRRLIGEHPDVIYSTLITGDAITFVKQALHSRLAGRTPFYGVMDPGTFEAPTKSTPGVDGYTYYPSAAIYHTPFAAAIRSLASVVANGGAAGDALNQIVIISQGIAKAKSTDPAEVRRALGGARISTAQGQLAIGPCDHLLAVPITEGTMEQGVGHWRDSLPPKLASARHYVGC